MASLASSRGFRLGKQAGLHLLIWMSAFGLFAAADSWAALTGLGLATLLCVMSGIIAGLTTTTLAHEWFHWLGAWLSGGSYDIPAKSGLFVYDWDFEQNDVRKFLIMSVAGSVGGALAVALLWNALPADTLGRAALRAAAIGSFVFAAAIEWPVLQRIRNGGDPLAELSKINQRVLSRSFIIAIIAGVLLMVMFAR